MTKTERLFNIAQTLADDWPRFFEKLGPGAGDQATRAYMLELRRRAYEALKEDFAEKCISGDNGLRVDFYFPEEKTVVEVAMGLRNPNSEFERDILKAIMAQEASNLNPVTSLIFLTKPGGHARANSPSAQAIVAWAKKHHDLIVEVREFGIVAENIIDDTE